MCNLAKHVLEAYRPYCDKMNEIQLSVYLLTRTECQLTNRASSYWGISSFLKHASQLSLLLRRYFSCAWTGNSIKTTMDFERVGD